MTTPEPMVPNPAHAGLLRLRARVLDDLETARAALLRAERAMASGRVWVGPAARTWLDELGERRAQARRAAQRVLDDLEDALSRHPAEVTATQAATIRRDLAGRMG